MGKINGKQLYGIKRILATLKIGMHPEMKSFSLRQKMGLNYVSKENKMTEFDGKIYTNTFTPYYPSPAYDVYLKGIKSISTGKPVPVITNFAVTANCICNCWHCSFSNRDTADKLSIGQLKKSISEVQDLGTSVIGFTGGEPLLREDLEEIISCVDERSMAIMFTTGYGLTVERVKGLKKAGLKIPVVSLDHYTPEVHDKGRRKEGVFEQSVKAIEMFKSEGFYTAISFVPDRELVDNREELMKTIEFFRDLGVNDMRLTSPILSGKLTSHPEDKLTDENVKTIFEVQKKCTQTKGYPGVFAYDYFENKKFYGCSAGYSYMFIDSMGNVSPCDFTMMSFGNIKDQSVGDLWNEMSSRFRLPGLDCYANRISGLVAEKNIVSWPLSRKDSLDIFEKCSPYDEIELPDFYNRMGMENNAGK